MREGWEYKKLGEVATLVADGDWIESKDQSEQGIRLIQTGNIGNGFFKSKDDKPHFISEETMSRLNCTEIFQGDCLVSRLPDPVGRACLIPNIGCRMITAVDCSIIRFSNDYLPQFFVDYSQSAKYRNSVNNNTTGTTRKRISRKNLEKIPIPIPPLAEQERIVEELDLLSSIIDKKKAQLKELDQLAQSIFYTMFGDPITNEKGWEVKKLGEVCENCDSMRKPITAKDRIQGLIPYYGASGVVDYVKDYIFDGEYLLISEDGANLLARSTPIAFSIKGKTWVNNHAHVLKFSNKSVQQYVEFTINLRDISSIVTGCAQPKLTQANLNRMPIPFPPLPLQQEFASKIEAIERQKSLIQQSIVETQTLFDSRMDHWFG